MTDTRPRYWPRGFAPSRRARPPGAGELRPIIERMGGDDATIPDSPSATAASARAVKLPSRYRILGAIGEGGMGKVYRAHDTTLNRDVAVKVIERELQGRD